MIYQDKVKNLVSRQRAYLAFEERPPRVLVERRGEGAGTCGTAGGKGYERSGSTHGQFLIYFNRGNSQGIRPDGYMQYCET